MIVYDEQHLLHAVSQKIKLPTTKKVQVGAGTLSGLMGGFFGMQGPPAVLYFIQSEPTKEHYIIPLPDGGAWRQGADKQQGGDAENNGG